MTSVIIFLVIIAATAFFVMSIYNRLVGLRNQFKNAFSQIDVQLKRRYDLIPNLVETAKGYMKHESQTLENVIQARNQAVSASQAAAAQPGDSKAMGALSGAEGQLTRALGGFFAIAESYPDLKAQSTMQQLMEELSSTENKVGFSRQAFNDSVMSYNTAREQFPAVLFANAFGFQPAELLQAIEAESERAAPKVSFA